MMGAINLHAFCHSIKAGVGSENIAIIALSFLKATLISTDGHTFWNVASQEGRANTMLINGTCFFPPLQSSCEAEVRLMFSYVNSECKIYSFYEIFVNIVD